MGYQFSLTMALRWRASRDETPLKANDKLNTKKLQKMLISVVSVRPERARAMERRGGPS